MARIQFTEKANLGKKVSESLPKQPRVAESLSKLEEVKAEEQVGNGHVHVDSAMVSSLHE